ncbi:MAG TPA: CHAT domain-containing tetratricopeptide repeat protein [Blastocatellia bacterium]|nr:CHAT domain-containing tetratricopeptide repeat protein [Blastocatellia bacterium]
MIKRRHILLLMLYLLLPVAAPQAQDDDVLTRENDRSATTREARERSLTILLAAASQSREAGEASKAARFLNRAGHLQLLLNVSQDAIATYQQALTILDQTPDPRIKVDSLNGLGSVYTLLSKCSDAQNLLNQAIALSEQNGYAAGKAQALLTLSECQNYGDHALALTTAQEALALWQSVNDKWGIAMSYSAIGDYQLGQDNLPEAITSYQTALDLWRELDSASGQAAALITLGFIEYRKGAWQNVFEFLTQAQNLIDAEAEPFRMGQIHLGLGEAFIESGLHEIGLAKYIQGLDDYRRAESPQGVVAAVYNIGRSYYFLGNYAEAQTYLQRSLADSEPIKEMKNAALCNDYLGRTFRAMNNEAEALRYFEVAIELYTRLSCPMEVARTRAFMGQVYQQQGKIEQARTYYQMALKIFRALSDQVNQSATLYALGGLELKQRNFNLAEDYLRQSIEVTEEIRRASTSSDLTAAFSATVYERYEKYIDCLMHQTATRNEQSLVVRAFETSEVARARSLAELLRATQTNLIAGLDPKLAEQEKSLRQSLKVKEDYKVALLSKPYKVEDLAALDAELSRLQAEYKQLNETIRASYPSYEQITRPAGWNLRQIQEQVIADDQTVLLEYSLGSEQSYVWAVTRDSIQSYNLPARALINATAQKVYKLLAAPPSPDAAKELNAAVQELSQLVLSPVAAELNKSRIIVVADGALHYIPFQVLPSPAGGEPLVAAYEIINTPSASILGELRKEATRRQPEKVLAAFGDPVFAENYAVRKESADDEQPATVQTMEVARLQHALRDIELNGDSFDPSVIKPLFYAKRELAYLRDAASSGETFVASEFTASRQQLLNTDLTEYAILHFATHGLLDPRRPENSGLVLSTVNSAGQEQNGFVGLQDIYGLRAPVDLVVLSACQTALGKDVRGEGLLGLTRGFMYAGASSVVASLWKVDDEATAELMRQFYTNMLRGEMTPADALRAAQNNIRQRPEWQAPYYWAGFTLQGEYRQVIKPPASGLYWKILIGAALALLIGGAFWYRHRRLRTVQESR